MDDIKWRKQNIVWTVSEDYSYEPIIKLFDVYQDFNMDYYRMLLLGYVYKKINMHELLDYIAIHFEKTKLKNEFLKTIEIFLDDCFGKNLIIERPGAEKYRVNFLEKINEKYKNRKNLEVEEEIESLYSAVLVGKFSKSREVVEQLVSYMHMRNNARTTDEVIEAINGAFLKFFYENVQLASSNKNKRNIDKEDSEEKKSKESKNEKRETPRINFKMKRRSLNKNKESIDTDSFLVESAEFTKNISEDEIISDERLESSNSMTSDNNKIKNMVESRYGEASIPVHNINRIEKEVSTGIHDGIKIHFTEGNFVNGKGDPYFSKAVENQNRINTEFYKENELIFRRSINELKELLTKKLLLNDEDESEITNNGKLVVSKIWRHQYLNDDKIFQKNNISQLGSISVDILLDASASQIGREEQVSSQAYVIAEALSSLNIPTRVIGFCNFFNYLVLTQYRDYNDSVSANRKIFNYKASGSNRDGLAIKLISNQMDSIEYENKVLIVLSDGKPNDKIDLGASGFIKVDGDDYEGEIAVKDTAQEVFNLKLRDKHILGVFTGEENDLEYEKRIYGKDFAYIKNINRFSHTIVFYLQQMLK
ncbi:vWA domain-containing protein [Peptostreptococcus faecalis]|uniref:hypothetical protein n=1 Tax=Peptostreptococcus faecalis TaxID=2045015 RepID=UPI000C79F7B4|nr:hypothetical protein [Peptostreptococcus faecalis]